MRILLMFLLLCLVTAAHAEPKPNIVIIMTDNLGYGDLGVYGGLRAPTPRIDTLAQEGVRFRDFQVEPFCLPTRAAMLTGRLPIRSGTSGKLYNGRLPGLDPMEVTLAEVVRGAGYRTALYGKWGLGGAPERQPQMQGFEEFYGILHQVAPFDPTFPGIDEQTIVMEKILQAKEGRPAEIVGELSLKKRGQLDRELATMSSDYIRRRAKTDTPFFLLVSFVNPHLPVVPHPDFVGKSGGGAYADVLMEIDYNTGLVLDAINDSGVRDNTIVVWMSDNGPTRLSSEPDHNGDPGPWSGELGSAWEGGVRTAGMMRWPGKIKKTWVSDEIFHVMDLYTTIGKIAGGKIPTDRPIDGFDQAPYLFGDQLRSERDHVVTFLYGELTAVRWRQFKAHHIIFDRFQSFFGPKQELGLLPRIYNLKADPKELYSLTGRSGAGVMLGKFHEVTGSYMKSFKKFPNMDYSKMTRSE